MKTAPFEELSCSIATHRLNTGMLRRWSSPEVILVVTDLTDEQSIQFHAIQQARPSGAKVLLVEVGGVPDARPRSQHLRGRLSSGSVQGGRNAGEQIVSHLRSSGIACEPVVVRSLPVEEIASIARSCCADRVLVSAPIERQDSPAPRSIADRIIDELEIPVCVVGRDLSVISRYQRPSRRITLALSLYARNEIPIAFSSRFAQESHCQLTIIHVFPERLGRRRLTGEMQTSFVSHLPSVILREAELLCPVEIAVREGDTSKEILNYDSVFNQDFLVLAPPREGDLLGLSADAVGRIIREARCPVIVLKEEADAHD